MKKCPYCYEEIQEEAIKCKHCFEWIEHLKGAITFEQESSDPLHEWITYELQSSSSETIFDDIINKIEKKMILEALRISENNRSKSARLLGLSRPTLHAKIVKHKL